MSLVEEAEKYVKNLFLKHKNELLLFHNLGYIKKTIEFTKQICEKEEVNESQKEEIFVAAWLFSTGFLFDYIDHKRQSIRVAHAFLKDNKADIRTTEAILLIIEAVLQHKPRETKSEKILYDASEFYTSADDFLLWVKYHRQERNYFLKPKLTKRSFWQTSQNYLSELEFATQTGKELFEKGKKKNQEKITFALDQELQKQLPVDNQTVIRELKEEISQINQKVEKRLSSARGFDTLYRITARNQIALSGIADNKSNILISLNTLIVSAMITFALLKFDVFQFLMLPAFATLAFSAVSISFAILSTRPQIRPGRFSMEDFHNKKVNLLFYGNFYKMDYADYEVAIREMIKDQDLLLANLSRDQFTLGKILGRKFRLLNISFTVFLYGFVISAVLFAITAFFFNPELF